MSVITEEKIEEIVASVMSSMDEEEKVFLRNTKKEDLIQFHHTVGSWIRNEFKLWGYKFTPELVDGVDMSPNHPDAVSMRIIEKIWELCNKE